MLDVFLDHPAYRDHIDASLIGGWGASLGGQALMINQGAKLTTSISGGQGEVVVTDRRIKAIVGYVPFSGVAYSGFISASFATFGDANEGVRGLRMPYLAIAGDADTVAPIAQTLPMVRNLSGSRYLVTIAGLEHTFVPEHAPDIFTWSILFYRAHLFGDVASRNALASTRSVGGVANDSITLSVTQPWWYQDETSITEYYHAGLKHYFMTGIDGEKQMLDGNPALGWVRTGESFLAWRGSAPTASQAFRFYHDARGMGANTHVFTLDSPEAASLRARPQDWQEEQSSWRAFAVGSGCPTGYQAVTRAYNNRFAFGDSNHRFMTNATLPAAMRGLGWVVEGTVMCAIQP